ncbi:MAG: response regulator [Cyanobacteria bacterium J06642_12]
MFRSIQQAVALILQSSPTQGRLWKVALESQGFKVIWGSPDIDILTSIETFQPEVALIDVSKGNFNPFEISRQSAKLYPSASIVFTNHKRQKIYPSERRWAKKQNAADLISAPTTLDTLRATVARIVEISGTPITFNSKALTTGVIKQLQPKRSPRQGAKASTISTVLSIKPLSEAFSPIAGIIRDIAALPDANATAKSSFNATQPVMYRGRAIAPSSTAESTDLEESTVTLPPQFDSPFPHLFSAPENPENPDSPYVVC